jgi:hypothetical protein
MDVYECLYLGDTCVVLVVSIGYEMISNHCIFYLLGYYNIENVNIIELT